MTSYARKERAALCDLLEDRGPQAPTLCAGWTTADLAAHLVVRERKPLAALGIMLPPMAPLTRRSMDGLRRSRSFDAVVELVRAGPPRWSPLGVHPALDAAANTLEFFVHHEDVRRAADRWEPRRLEAEFAEALWHRLARAARLMTRNAPCGVRLRTNDGRTARGRTGEPVVTVIGDPPELTLFAFGRQAAARVEFSGDESAVAALRSARLGA